MDNNKQNIDNEPTSSSVLYGRTSSGKVFKVPKTRDMIETLFSFSGKLSVPSLITLIILSVKIILFFLLPNHIGSKLFLITFLFWRGAYNGFLGYLLYRQSNQKYLFHMINKLGFLDDNTYLGKWTKQQLIIDMGSDYNYHSMPLEFNTWLIFRKLVDLILVNDFVCYLLFSFSNFKLHSDWAIWENCLRYLAATLLILFNLIVKLDAHRVVKDFAWYWGDFFFLIDQKLTFDGVFELAPHPMYSLGYAGYYGISLLTASPNVFYVSLLAHSAQFIFLILVENPHIEKTYPSPTVQQEKKQNERNDINQNDFINRKKNIYNIYFDKKWINKFDPFKSADLFSLIIVGYGILILFFMLLNSIGISFDFSIKLITILHALSWRLFHSFGLGIFVLGQQSDNKRWTRHYIKIGKSVMDAFIEWKSIYNLSSFMTYLSFIITALAFYTTEKGFFLNSSTLRHTFGILLIILHCWTSISVYEVLEEYGWYYGDFFLDKPEVSLNYTGIYRYLNNPEKIIGQSALYGIALMSNSGILFLLAIVSHLCYLIFYYWVESPHMKKLYKGKLRKEAGVTKTVKGAALSLKSNLKHSKNLSLALSSIEFTESLINKLEKGVERSINETKETLGGLVEKTKPHLKELITDTNSILNQSKLKLAETRERLLLDLDTEETIGSYKIELIDYLGDNQFNPAKFELGQPIKLRLIVPYGGRNKYDWIGLYKVVSNPSTTLTTESSNGRFLYTHLPPKTSNNLNEDLISESSGIEITDEEESSIHLIDLKRNPKEVNYYESILPLKPNELEGRKGNWRKITIVFKGSKLFWEGGTYEFRLHKGYGHKVATISRPFEITLPKFIAVPKNVEQLTNCLLPFITASLELDTKDIQKIDQLFNNSEMEVNQADRISKIIKALYHIEFEPLVILSHSNLSNLAQRILEAQKVLEPFKIPTPTMKPTPYTGESPNFAHLDDQ